GLIAFLPAIAAAQQRPATPPPARPAPARVAPSPAAGPHGSRGSAWQLGLEGGIMYLDQAFNGLLNANPAGPLTAIHTSTSRILPGARVSINKQLGEHFALGVGGAFFTGGGTTVLQPTAEMTIMSNINNN